jgi:hypothetical protein
MSMSRGILSEILKAVGPQAKPMYVSRGFQEIPDFYRGFTCKSFP